MCCRFEWATCARAADDQAQFLDRTPPSLLPPPPTRPTPPTPAPEPISSSGYQWKLKRGAGSVPSGNGSFNT